MGCSNPPEQLWTFVLYELATEAGNTDNESDSFIKKTLIFNFCLVR